MAIRLISWNVNGIRAAERKGFIEWLNKSPADIVCVQETKISQTEQLSKNLLYPDGYESYWHCAKEKKGYSGVAIFSKIKPEVVKTEFGDNLLSKEGRMMELDFNDFILFNVYFPNGGAGEARLKYKLEFYKQFLARVKKLSEQGKKIIFCGDLNTAHNEIDLARPKANENNSGFMRIERDWLDKFENAGFIDTFRLLYPTKQNAYSWWDLKTRSRERNVGWRLDYFWVSRNLKHNVIQSDIMAKITGSDHCPVSLDLNIKL